ncbi:MAG: DUF2207 domain-containing protein [Pseudomonadota bacterium]
MIQFTKASAYLYGIATLILLQFAGISYAAEVIRSFDSLVEVEKDGTFIVTETITVKAEGKEIRRGIFRDFPIYFEGENGRKHRVGFELLSVKRDGQDENSFTEAKGDRIRIYIGKENVFLQPGVYEYTIVYKTTRQIRFFETHDEVYWNATGNFWNFPIQKATAKVRAPEGSSFTDADAFTGVVGSTERAVNVARIAGKTLAKYTATRTLKPGEGLTILAKLPKGAVNPPSEAQTAEWFWEDNKNILLAVMTLLVVGVFYFVTWWRVGRDPSTGTIVPRWDIPSNMSPALVNYIHRKGLSGKGFDAISAALLNLGVKGLVTLDKEEGGFLQSDTLIIRKTGNRPEEPLPVGEAAILSSIGSGGLEQMRIDKDNGRKVKALQTKFSSAIEKEHRNKFYQANAGWIFLGVILSIAGIALTLFFGNFTEEEYTIVIFGGAFLGFISSFIFSIARSFASGSGLAQKIKVVVTVAFISFAVISSGVAAAVASVDIFNQHSMLLSVVIGIVMLNVLFFFLLGAPTALGRKRMDEIEGLKTYLTLAEKDRMNMADAPDFSTQHFEDLLPYAVALGVEKPWSRAFETWLAAAVAAGAVAAGYSPNWYRGSDFRRGGLSDTMGSFTDSMQSGFSSAMPVPKSSSSGFSGGGSSGGGGGGGGGGGW